MPHRFTNDILKPWDELNDLLSLQYAFHPNISDITRLAGGIAVSLRHQTDSSTLTNQQANDLSIEHRVIADVADYWKHGNLRNENRNSPMTVVANFEYQDDKFSFIKNAITIQHRRLGEYDFMETSAEAAKFWMSQKGHNVDWLGTPKISEPKWDDMALLKFNSKYCIRMSEVRFRFYKKNSNGELELFDPPIVKFGVL
jgi:hypothetical protein